MSQIKTALRKMDWVSTATGWGCGYVAVPPGHPWHGKPYDEIECSVHGGLTWGEDHVPNEKPDSYWWLGFDTAHGYSDPATWTKEKVAAETEELKRQAMEAQAGK